MALLDLFNSSCQADAMCLVYCKAQANLILDSQNAVLVRIRTKSGLSRIVWMDKDDLVNVCPKFRPAFYEFQDIPDAEKNICYSKQVLKPNEDVFAYNGGAYFLYQMPSGNQSIRMLKAYGSQKIVENLEHYAERHNDVENIYLANFYATQGSQKQYVLTCWGIVRHNGCDYLPIFADDLHYLEEHQPDYFLRYELNVGEIFKRNNYYYKVIKDADGKLCLLFSKLVFALNNDKTDAKLGNSAAQIISLRN